MVERYLHIEVNVDQRSKHRHQACGDAAAVVRTDTSTTVVLCDGIGSGTAAHVAARMCQARLERLLEEGFSLHEAFQCVAASMEQYKQPGKPYAAFTVAQIRNDGHATLLGYESPPAIWIASRQAQVLGQHKFMQDAVCGVESVCYLRSGEGLLLLTDGITQSAMGDLSGGWQSQGVADFVSGLLQKKQAVDLPRQIQEKAAALNGGIDHDDATVVWMPCRLGRPLSILTGPPKERLMDMAVVERFMAMPGPKIVCGATTAAIVARMTGKDVQVEKEPTSLIAPPKYILDCVDLVTEGAVTLNQLNNVLEIDPEQFSEINAVTDMYDLLAGADRINIFMGMGQNPANESVCFAQRGVLSRETIIPLIAQKLRRQGKCVIVEPV